MLKLYIPILTITALTGFASGQTLLSNFSGNEDGWSGIISPNTPFPNGLTGTAQTTEDTNGVLSIADTGFTGGASRVYNVHPLSKVITVVADLKIDTDPGANGTLDYNMAFGLKLGNGTGTPQDFAYSRSRGTINNDSGQSFQRVAAALYLGNNGQTDITAAFTPDKTDWVVDMGTWVVRIDNIYETSGASNVPLDSFDSGITNWSPINATNSPFPAGSTTVSAGSGVLNINDGGFDGGAVGLYPGAFTAAGVHTIMADIKIVTDPGSLTNARLAAAPGTTTNPGDLSWSRSFATTADDSGQSFVTLAVPVETTGPADLALYVLPSFTGSAGAGAWSMEVDNIRYLTYDAVPIGLSDFSLE